MDGRIFLLIHLMPAGRLHWKPAGAVLARKTCPAAFDFDSGTLVQSEAGSRRRASLHVVRGEAALARHDAGGLEAQDADEEAFRERLLRENRTLERRLTDPRLLSGMAVRGRHRKPCPVCGSPVQRIVYASNETNTCARCQTDGNPLADRALSRSLKKDWPRSLARLEARSHAQASEPEPD